MLLVSATASNVRAPTVYIEWQAPMFYVDGLELSPENISHFTVHFGTMSKSYSWTQEIPGSERSANIVVPHNGNWYIAMTATDIFNLTSDFSNEVVRTATNGPKRPKPMRITFI